MSTQAYKFGVSRIPNFKKFVLQYKELAGIKEIKPFLEKNDEELIKDFVKYVKPIYVKDCKTTAMLLYKVIISSDQGTEFLKAHQFNDESAEIKKFKLYLQCFIECFIASSTGSTLQ